MQEPLLVFDVETQRTANEVGGWSNIRRMGLSVAVTYTPHTDTYRTFLEDDVAALLSDLRCAGLIVGYNVQRFDYEVLRAYTSDPLADLPTADLLLHLHAALGWRPRLDDVAAATLGERKNGDGLAAVRWFREGLIDRVAAYCRRDVELTWRLYDFGRQHRHVAVFDRYRRTQQVPVDW